MSDGQGELLRTMRRGEAKIPGFLEDYAFLTHGLLMLYRATQTQRHLEAAKRLAAAAEARFDASATHGGGYFETRENQPDLFVRVRGTYDGAVPSGNSVMVHNLLNLYKYTEDEAYMERAVKDLRSFGASLPKMGAAMQQMQHALLRAFEMNPALAQTAAADVHQQGEKAGEPSRRQFACRLAEKAYRLKHSVHIRTPDEPASHEMDTLLWTFRDGSFVPHELCGEGGGEPLAPVTIGPEPPAGRRPDLLINLAGDLQDRDDVPRVAEIVSADDGSRASSRQRYARYRELGHTLETHKL